MPVPASFADDISDYICSSLGAFLTTSAIPSWVVNLLNPPNLAFDWANNRAWNKVTGATVPATSVVTASRTTTNGVATAPDGSGNYVQFADNAPRITTGAGLWSEEPRINGLRNPGMLGAVVADGVERIVNGTFTGTSGTGWTVVLNAGTGSVNFGVTGQASILGDGTHQTNLTQSITTIIGLTYTVRVTVAVANAFVQAGNSIGTSALLGVTGLIGTNAFQFVATATTTFIGFAITAAATTVVSGISVQSAGQLPNFWTGFSSNATGMVRTVTALGTESGMSTIDIELSAQATAVGGYNDMQLDIVGSTQAYGQTWVQSGFQKVVAGTTPVALIMLLYGTPSFSDNNSVAAIPTATGPQSTALGLTRVPVPKTFLTSANNAASARYAMTPAAGAYDVTIRIGIPQLENNSLINATVASATIAAGGSGGADASGVTLTVVGGTGTAATLVGTITGGILVSLQSVSGIGNYTVLPASPAAVTGGSLVGATLNLTPTNNAALAFATTPIISNGTTAGARGGETNALTASPVFGPALSTYEQFNSIEAPITYSVVQNFIDITDNSVSNRFMQARSSATAFVQQGTTGSGVGNTSISGGIAIAQGATGKVAGTFASGLQQLVLNGGNVLTQTGTNVPINLTVVGIGNRFAGNLQNINGAIGYTALWTTQAVPGAQLQSMTT